MHAIQEWINNHLIEWGIISSSANELDNAIVLLLIIVATVGIDYACRYIFLNMFKRLAKRTRNQWDDLIVERKIINKLMHMIPAILVYVLLPLAFPVDETPKILGILQMICKIYIIAVSLRFISASLYAFKIMRSLKFGETYINRENFEAMQGFHAGWRKSGIGGADGKHGLEEYLQTHVVYIETKE